MGTEPIDRPRLLRELIGHLIDMPVEISGPGLEPWHEPLIDGYVRAAAAILTGSAGNGAEFVATVRTALIDAAGAVEEEGEFLANPDAYLDSHRLPRRDMDGMADRLEGERESALERLGSLRPMAKVVGL